MRQNVGAEANVNNDVSVRCACGGCGRPPTGRSRYFEDHRQVAVVVRRLLRNATRNGARRGVRCSLTAADLLPLVLDDWPRTGRVGLEVRRVDPGQGVHAGNVRLVETGRERRVDLRSALARCATGARELGLVVDDLVALWRRQRGRCVLSGLELEPDQGAWHPASVVVARDARGRAALLARAVHAVAGTWGPQVLRTIARAVVARPDEA